ncbi:MAG: DPP IV N-terminal domain-containing protein [Bacteroidales bacterium]|jgi:dipeptidyl-peptidase-4
MKQFFSLLLILSAISSFSQPGTKKITLDDIFKNRKFASRGISGLNSMKDGEHYYQLKKDSINVYEYATGNLTQTLVTSKDLIPAGDTAPISMGNFSFSMDEKKILFSTDEEPIYRHSSKANYYFYEIAGKKLSLLSKAGKQRLATFSPDGTKIAFVRDNDIFMVDLITGKEKQVTKDGKINEIINGATDWVYEEEFEFSQAFFWSPDSKNITFYRFDESKVKEYQLTYYGDLYPEQYKYKYPKAGEDNSRISIFIWNVSSGKSKQVDIGQEQDIYIPRVKWTEDPAVLAFYRMNRHQSKLELLLAAANSGKSHIIYTEENKDYIEINDHWYFLKDKSGFLLTSEKDGFRHIYLYAMDGKLIRQVTSGKWEVTDIAGVDEVNKRLYYVSTEVSPLERNLYSIGLDGKNKTCLTPKKGYNVPEFSSNCKYFVNRWSDINTPSVNTVDKSDGTEIRTLQDNAKLKETLKDYGFSKAEFFTFKTNDGVELNGWMLKPPDFDPSKKYPVLFTIYGGPGSQTVMNLWGMVSSWDQLLAQNGIILVSVDNRGTGARGEEFKKCTYLELGKYETLDQIDAAKYLGSLPYIDKDRIGMWGWSFGGYMTLSCLTKGADYFKMGVAVAPVTNWKYYDNIYTERFMRTPKENPAGYEDNSPINHADELKGKLLILHGMADDNVHTQNSIDFITALVAANKQFDMQYYPNSNHGIYTGKNTTFHLYTRMTDYILKNL